MNAISLKLKFRPSRENKSQAGAIFFELSYDGQSRWINTDLKILPKEWNPQFQNLRLPYSKERYEYLIDIRDSLKRIKARILTVCSRFDEFNNAFSLDDVIYEYATYLEEISFNRFISLLIVRLKRRGKIRTSETYAATLKDFDNFLKEFKDGNKDIPLDCFSSELLLSYEAWMLRRGRIPNSTSFYMRILRAVYNRAVKEGLIKDSSPFREVFTGIDKTTKRAISLSSISKLKSIDLSGKPHLQLARDVFLMSFYLRGISFIDLAFMKKTDLKDGVISYRRKKTGSLINVKWISPMQDIIDRYPDNPTDFLMPLITSSTEEPLKQYRRRHILVNRHLKKVCELAGVPQSISTYVARHSWATAAKSQGIPVGVISSGLGHTKEETTLIYLASIDSTAIDDANDILINAI